MCKSQPKVRRPKWDFHFINLDLMVLRYFRGERSVFLVG